MQIQSIDELDVGGKRVLLRVDINSPIDLTTGKIRDDNRLRMSLPTIRDLANAGARLVVIAHQGDTLDYHNLVSLEEHAEVLGGMLGRSVGFVDDVAGPAAREAIQAVEPGGILLLDNLRFLTEEVSTFENSVKLTAAEMTNTYLVRNLAPLFDFYVNDAFAAAHRNSPSMVAFQELLPSAGGRLLVAELDALSGVADHPARPCVFVLGGLKISDAFSMMRKILSEGTADTVLTSGITGQVMLMASGVELGEPSEAFIRNRSLDAFLEPAADYLQTFPEKIRVPIDVAIEWEGSRVEIPVTGLPAPAPIIDIGTETVRAYRSAIGEAATIFVNGPAGVYESEAGSTGTQDLLRAVADADGFSVIGGGDTVASARRFVDLADIGFVSTAGGALIRYLSGQPLPLLAAMTKTTEHQ